jgi:hypothetical protein
MRIVANFQLHGVYGDIGPDEAFDCPEDIGEVLLKNNQARIPDPPKILYETKVVAPLEVGPVVPFRDMPMSHEEPKTVATESNPVFSKPDASKSRTADSCRRRGRIGFGKRSK